MPSAMLELEEKKQKRVRHVGRINYYFNNNCVSISCAEVVSMLIRKVCLCY